MNHNMKSRIPTKNISMNKRRVDDYLLYLIHLNRKLRFTKLNILEQDCHGGLFEGVKLEGGDFR